ncbi:hypothetical protein HUS84_03180 [Pseudomonas chlororaphis]|uniref:hypothetical protein n=1 Tax=Pseudomonas chlororaphis TaxID=587753 RepID=UPI001B324E04|nr:hypothetical protein [Pseudomonas chlororaphis]MBP5073020.1 hypothetical protein [Pseudomonas chlororaphis]
MQPGDLVFTVARDDDPLATSVPRTLIALGERLKAAFLSEDKPGLPIVHVALAINKNHVVESVGGGVELTNLVEDKRNAMVFTCEDRYLADAAAYVAKQFFVDVSTGEINGEYSLWKAMLSTFRRSSYDQGLEARINASVDIGVASFCSEFVANAYEVGNLYTSANIIPPPPVVFFGRPETINPWELAVFCDSNRRFKFTGFWEKGKEVTL